MLNNESQAGTENQQSTGVEETSSVHQHNAKPNVSCSVYVFFRNEGFYPIELRDDEDAIKNAILNKGTLRVEDINGRVVWQHYS